MNTLNFDPTTSSDAAIFFSPPAFDAAAACMEIMHFHEIVEMLGEDRDNFDHIVLVMKLIEPKVTELYEHLAG